MNKSIPTLKDEKSLINDVVDVLILVTPHGNVSDDFEEYAVLRTMTTGYLDKFVDLEENQQSVPNMDAFKKVFSSFESKLNLKRKQNVQLNQIEAKKVKTSVR